MDGWMDPLDSRRGQLSKSKLPTSYPKSLHDTTSHDHNLTSHAHDISLHPTTMHTITVKEFYHIYYVHLYIITKTYMFSICPYNIIVTCSTMHLDIINIHNKHNERSTSYMLLSLSIQKKM